MSQNNLTIYKSNKVIEAGYKLSLNEQRLILVCIAKVNSSKPLTTDQCFEVNIKEFASFFDISEHRAYQTLKDVSEQLFERYVIIDNPDPTNKNLKHTRTRWISAINYYPDEGKVSLIFSQFMIPYLSQLKGQFTFYQLENVSNMSSTYAIRLYELLMQWKSVGQREIEIEWLKKQFELSASYSRMNNLKARVIEPAIKDINTYSDYHVTWTQRKTGRRVTHFIFDFHKKRPENVSSKQDEAKVDNLVYFAEMREKYGDVFWVPPDIEEQLKKLGKW